jgi:NAD(P)-dependent dehydrogenase (short-subunit alcohol dehydrogenase family)
MQIRNSVALVTGANRGIGRELVAALLKAGAAKVYAGARRLDSLDATKALDPGRVVPLLIDVTDRDCQSALKFDPVSASNFDPFERRVLAVALASSELAGIAETWRARVV